MLILILLLLTIVLVYFINRLNRVYYIINLSKRVQTVDGSKLESKIPSINGKTIFGNNFDFLNLTPEQIFLYIREETARCNGKSFLLHILTAPIYNVTNAVDVEEVLQNQMLTTKGFTYDVVKPFLGQGLLISSASQWQFRRKLLVPAFHFNILQTFIDIFKEESNKFTKVINKKLNQVINLDEVIPKFTLNNVCETALGVKLDDEVGSELYRQAIHDLEPIFVERFCNPLMYNDLYYRIFGPYKEHQRLIKITHDFSSKIIEKRRKDFQQNGKNNGLEKVDDFGKKRRYAVLDTLLDAERQGLIDHQGICDEVNTIMYGGFDTTSVCLMFAITSLAWNPDIQQKCFEEIENLGPFETLTVFDFNKLEYLECVIKETLRLYPSVPFLARTCTTETVLNGLILPKNTQINIHVFDIMRDERHFPEPGKFDPERFRPENTKNRHPYAFVPFSAGIRNCIGQKMGILEVKVLLVSFLKNFQILPVVKLEDLNFINGIVLRCKEKLTIKVVKRV